MLLQGHTPLMFAAIGGHVDIVNLLLTLGACASPANSHVSSTPMHTCVPPC